MIDEQYYVYILKCVDNTFYCGITNDLIKRVNTHNAGKGSKYTRGRLPVYIEYCEIVEDKSKALKREYAIKQMSKNQKIKLINSQKIK